MSVPFTQPFTAPDGSQRRPLAERVPECWPNALNTPQLSPPEARIDITSVVAANLFPDIAAALWRVAVEDWLLSSKDVWLGTDDVGSSVHIPGTLPPENGTSVGPKMAHALNAAAHAVADAMGIAP
jgi:hypothetical protein